MLVPRRHTLLQLMEERNQQPTRRVLCLGCRDVPSGGRGWIADTQSNPPPWSTTLRGSTNGAPPGTWGSFTRSGLEVLHLAWLPSAGQLHGDAGSFSSRTWLLPTLPAGPHLLTVSDPGKLEKSLNVQQPHLLLPQLVLSSDWLVLNWFAIKSFSTVCGCSAASGFLSEEP